ncbi:recombination protein F [Parerythrobacter jejuensis]|nr:recombination protein F [Parerythrobacter jejuensis]
MTLNFDANRLFAAAFAVALSAVAMATAIVPATPAGLIA